MAPDWLLPDVPFPVGALGVLAGQQGIGKSLLIARWAADLTALGHGVMFVADEDEMRAVLVPRLQAVGADLARVFQVTPRDPDDMSGVRLPDDTAELAHLAAGEGIRMCVFDPWTNHVVGDHDKGSEVRQTLMTLARMGQQSMMSVVLVGHPVKADTGDPLTQIAHASALTQVARAALYLTLDPEAGSAVDARANPSRLLHDVKNNLSHAHMSLRYRIDTVLLAEDDQPEMTVARLVRDGASDLSYYDVAERQRAARNALKRPTVKGEAKQFLREFLADGGRPRPDVIDAAEQAGHNEKTVQRAFKELGGVSERPAGAAASVPVTWSLPPAEKREPAPAAEEHEPVPLTLITDA